ncbi:MAG: MFS transporter [Chloroflexota bacterium]|nr:MFS transporter [Chloroflexota bacterium]
MGSLHGPGRLRPGGGTVRHRRGVVRLGVPGRPDRARAGATLDRRPLSVGSLCGLSLAYWNALLACVIMGFGVGGEAPITFALAAEYTPARQRAKMLLVLGLVGSLAGYALAASTAAVVKSFLPEDVAWRLLWLVGILPAVLILVARNRIVPESARYLIEQGRIEEAREAAEHLVHNQATLSGIGR